MRNPFSVGFNPIKTEYLNLSVFNMITGNN